MGALERLRYHIYQFLKKLRLDWDDFIHPKSDEEYIKEIEARYGITFSDDISDFEDIGQEVYNKEPELDPRRTMLIRSMSNEIGCNAITATTYRKKILIAREWARQHGITTFLADFHTPLGLLALETLIELREAGESFRVYAVKSTYFAKRRTYRAIPETGMEMAFLAARADYSYEGHPKELFLYALTKAATVCTERGIWIARDKLPPYLLDAWDV